MRDGMRLIASCLPEASNAVAHCQQAPHPINTYTHTYTHKLTDSRHTHTCTHTHTQAHCQQTPHPIPTWPLPCSIHETPQQATLCFLILFLITPPRRLCFLILFLNTPRSQHDNQDPPSKKPGTGALSSPHRPQDTEPGAALVANTMQ